MSAQPAPSGTPAQSQSWRLASVALFCGLPILLLGLLSFNLFQSLQATDLTERQSSTRLQILSQVSKRRSDDRPRANVQALYLSNDSPTLARAEVQERATRLVEQAGGRIVEALLISTPEQEAMGRSRSRSRSISRTRGCSSFFMRSRPAFLFSRFRASISRRAARRRMDSPVGGCCTSNSVSKPMPRRAPDDEGTDLNKRFVDIGRLGARLWPRDGPRRRHVGNVSQSAG